jgi:hypothetical protein
MTAVTYQGAVVELSGTAVDDETTEFTLTPDTDMPTAMTFAGQVSAAGSTTWKGQITCVYDITAGSAYALLLAETQTPTSGGYAMTFQPEGATTGKEEIQVMAAVGYPAIEAKGDGGIQLRTFPFTLTTNPTFTSVA